MNIKQWGGGVKELIKGDTFKKNRAKDIIKNFVKTDIKKFTKYNLNKFKPSFSDLDKLSEASILNIKIKFESSSGKLFKSIISNIYKANAIYKTIGNGYKNLIPNVNEINSNYDEMKKSYNTIREQYNFITEN